ncbi:MAG TPA: M24 family metallopeptidase [Gemmatimonadaceae bacterium]|nr:M24 family metallopeptidase [Gemmatimonadaceae bacterium]
MRMRTTLIGVALAGALTSGADARAQESRPLRPFGTLREQATVRQQWLHQRMETVLPALMRKYGVDMWVIPMREYNEDPVFSSIVAPTTFAARRRTIYVFFDRGAEAGVERLALGGTSQGGVYEAVRSQRAVSGSWLAANRAEIGENEQWLVLKDLIEQRKPARIAINVSHEWAFADGLSAGEHETMRQTIGEPLTSRLVRVDGLAIDFIASRLPDEERAYEGLQRLVWALIDTAFSSRVITPGVTRTSDVVWWFRQRVNDLGLTSWFHPSVTVQRRGATSQQIGEDPIIQRGDVLHCDVGLVALGLATDTQHMGYVLNVGETEVPAGLRRVLSASNRLQDIVMQEISVGRTGNEILKTSLEQMRREGIDGSVYTHPIGVHGHGAGPLIGRWDSQDSVPGRGDHRVIPGMWFSIELQAAAPVPEWRGQRVWSAQEEDAIISQDGKIRWALRRQTEFHLVR